MDKQLLLGIFIGMPFCFLGGMLFDRFVLPFGDIILQSFVNRRNLEATKVSKDIVEVESEISLIRMSSGIPQETVVEGFRCDTPIEYYEDDEDVENKKNR